MHRIQFNLSLLECLDFASDTFAVSCTPFINIDTTKEQAIQLLRDIWTTGNDVNKLRWQIQLDKDEAAMVEHCRIQSESDDLRIKAEVAEAELARKEELKKNKSQYIPILDRDVPMLAPVIASSYTVRKMEKGLHVKLWYYTNAGPDEAFHNSNTIDNEAMVML